MYKIKWTRRTGETGMFAHEFNRKYEAQQAARVLWHIDAAKGQKDVYKYEIIES